MEHEFIYIPTPIPLYIIDRYGRRILNPEVFDLDDDE